ncbi:P2Y purinoceptor 14 [Triplophysa tibetana]|uniref:Probable G-protein coupled receptor 34 n=1 Tax=Triplophysa tibetana TaxID=1572043 RepID=A0A5A9MZ51_9TELE|nr:P2Y purinoceptor 14 [Triplophysa tibetana]
MTASLPRVRREALLEDGMESPILTTSDSLTNFTATTDDMKLQNTTCDKVPSHPGFIFAYTLVFLISLVLNCVTMRVYFCTNQRVKSSVTVYMKNLAAADFFLCLCLPFRIANYATHSVTVRNIYCSFGATAFYLNMYASMIFMDFIAANRYLKITRPLETHALQMVRTARNFSISTWLSLLAMASIYLVVFLQTSWSHDKNTEGFGCESLFSPKVKLVYKITHSVSMLLFIFVLVSLILFYWGTLKKIRQVQLSTQTKSNSHKFNKSKRNMLVLVVIFCVCFVPYHLVRLPYAFIDSTSQAFYILKELSVLLSVLNACLDPLIYFIFCKAFRAQLNLRKKTESSAAGKDQGPQISNMLSNIETKVSTLRHESVI